MFQNRIKTLENLVLAFLLFIGFSYIISSAYQGINGMHAWRQADVYSQILGFIGTKGFTKYDLFFVDHKAIYDIPIYQYMIAKLSVFVKSDPLVVTRFVNLALWLTTVSSGYIFATNKGNRLSGLLFLFIMSTSSLILHYFSVPLPDLLSIALSMIGITLLLTNPATWKITLGSTPFLVLATLIKSPVSFVFIVFTVTLLVTSDKHIFKERLMLTVKRYSPVMLLSILLIIAACSAELLRSYLLNKGNPGFAQDSAWYFGTLELRSSAIKGVGLNILYTISFYFSR